MGVIYLVTECELPSCLPGNESRFEKARWQFYVAEEKCSVNGGEGRQELFLADSREVNLLGPEGSSVSSPRGKLRLHLPLHMSERTALFEKTSLPTPFLAPQGTTCAHRHPL